MFYEREKIEKIKTDNISLCKRDKIVHAYVEGKNIISDLVFKKLWGTNENIKLCQGKYRTDFEAVF